MADYTAYIDWSSGDNIYFKPRPIVASPWDGDDVAAAENGTTGEYSATLDDTKDYVIYLQAGGSPVDTDNVIGKVSKASGGNTKQEIRDAINGRWTDEESNTFDLTVSDIP